MAPVVLAPLLAKGVGLGASALKYLPVIGAVGGALPGLRKGNLTAPTFAKAGISTPANGIAIFLSKNSC